MASCLTGVFYAKGAVSAPSTLDVRPSTSDSKRLLLTDRATSWGDVPKLVELRKRPWGRVSTNQYLDSERIGGMVREQMVASNAHELNGKRMSKMLETGAVTSYASKVAVRFTKVSHVRGAPFAPSTLDVRPSNAHSKRLLFNGREWIGEIGIYDYRNRVYSPELGRFLQTDPIRFEAGDVNLYRYVFNRPTRLRDPFGLDFRYPLPHDSQPDRDNAQNHPQNPSNPDATGQPAPSPFPDGPTNPGAGEGLRQIGDGIAGLIPILGPILDILDILEGLCKLTGLCPPDPCED